MSDIKVKAKVGDKVKIVKATLAYTIYYENGAEGVVIAAEEGWRGVDVRFTSGFKLSTDDSSQEFHVYHEEYEIIGSEAEKEKEVNQIKLNGNVYSIVIESTNEILGIVFDRAHAREAKREFQKDLNSKVKIVKMVPEKFVR